MSFHPSQSPASEAGGVLEIPAAVGDDADHAEAPTAQAGTIRLVIVEDDEGLLDSLSRILAMQPDIAVVGSYVSTEEAMETTNWLAVDVMLVDLGLPGVSGVDLIATATFKNPRLHTLVHTIHDDRDSLFAALRAGAVGYLIKGMPVPETLEAVRAVAIGTPSLSPSVARFLIDEFRSRSTAPPEETLSVREVELLHLSAQGLSSRKSASGSRSAPAPSTATSSGSTASCRSAAASRRCAAPRTSATSAPLPPASDRRTECGMTAGPVAAAQAATDFPVRLPRPPVSRPGERLLDAFVTKSERFVPNRSIRRPSCSMKISAGPWELNSRSTDSSELTLIHPHP